jgi:hypothetical protein
MDYMPGLGAFIMNPLAAAMANAAQPNAGITPSQPAPTMPTQASAPTTAMAQPAPQIPDYLTNLLSPSPVAPKAELGSPVGNPLFEALMQGRGSMSPPTPVIPAGPVPSPFPTGFEVMQRLLGVAPPKLDPPTAVAAPSAGPTSLTPGQQQAQRMMTAPNTPHPDWHTLDEFVNHYSGKLSNLDVMRILEAHKASTPEMQRYQTLETTSRNETQQKIAAILADTKLSDAKKNEAIRAAQFEHANRLFAINNPTSQLLGGIGAGPSPFAPTPK